MGKKKKKSYFIPGVYVFHVIGTGVNEIGFDDGGLDCVMRVFPEFFPETFHHTYEQNRSYNNKLTMMTTYLNTNCIYFKILKKTSLD